MTRRLMMLAMTVTTLLFGATHVVAHDEVRVIGTITKHEDSIIEVKDADSKKTSFRLDDRQTSVTRDNQAVGASELKVGVTVIVDGGGDNANLLAFEIRIVPPIARRK